MTPDVLIVIFAGVLGLLVGSFSNVLIWRLPRHESIAFPPSHCPTCDHRLGVPDLVPVVSWLSLGGKCRYCRAPIKARYPVVEVLTGLGYAVIALLFPPLTVGWGALGLMVLFTLLLVGSAIDLDTFTIPDELTLPGVAVGLLFGFLNGRAGVGTLPDLAGAVQGALLGAGVLVAINQFGSWVLRRFRERSYPEQPIGYQQISVGLLAGAWLGPWWGIGVGVLSALVNVAARRVVRVPEFLTLGGLLLSLVLGSAGTGPGMILMVQGALAAAGGVSLVAGVYWWLRREPEAEADGVDAAEDPYDASAMGFGDVKLAAVIGAFLGWERLLVALVVAVFAGAVLGLLQLAMKRENRVKFGPYLALGAVIALIWGQGWVQGYRSMLGL
ncbi:leader peptidase (prepilin peptidase)/N-methyltransferase [Deinococcus metalli]|uniref:Prepilin peptidase n=1 Tax=Deinococcus metalli TaxID=1141878 RepID=A0A7W8KGT2_9DEIO|nr:A24 family peptidase [Deinococcus metalli]MBB5377640.1 leader peptidase (prepilin peptidase)/N-methyltransferase [Deinococcus metalli]GHF52244.1 prepilin peptidase [Deinococcus metalli]